MSYVDVGVHMSRKLKTLKKIISKMFFENRKMALVAEYVNRYKFFF